MEKASIMREFEELMKWNREVPTKHYLHVWKYMLRESDTSWEGRVRASFVQMQKLQSEFNQFKKEQKEMAKENGAQ